MERLSKKKTEKKRESSLRDRFTTEREQAVIQPETRTVKLRYYSSCGCGGGGYTDIAREVPFNSPLKDGDSVDELKRGDKEI